MTYRLQIRRGSWIMWRESYLSGYPVLKFSATSNSNRQSIIRFKRPTQWVKSGVLLNTIVSVHRKEEGHGGMWKYGLTSDCEMCIELT